MGGKNYRRGSSFEWRWLDSLLKTGKAIRGARFFRSTGPRWKYDFDRVNDLGTDWGWKHAPVDVWWIDKEGLYNEAQLKYSSIKCASITTEEFLDLLEYAEENRNKFKVFLVSKQSRKKEYIWCLN